MARSIALIAATLGLVVGIPGLSTAADYPSKSVRLIIGFPPGGVTDFTVRQVADRVSKRLGQAVVVENRPGAFELLAINAVAAAERDGYTMLGVTAGFSSLPLLSKSFQYDVLKDFAPVSLIASQPTVYIGHASAPYRTVEELVAYMRANPGKVNFAYNAAGSYLTYALFGSVTKTKFEQVRYSGQAGMDTALLGGEQLIVRTVIQAAKALADSGKVRILGINMPTRSPLIPDVPSIAESSMPELRELSKLTNHQQGWVGIVAPGGVPAGVVSTWSRALRETAQDPGFAEAIRASGIPVGNTPEEFRELLTKELAVWTAIAKEINLQPQ